MCPLHVWLLVVEWLKKYKPGKGCGVAEFTWEGLDEKDI